MFGKYALLRPFARGGMGELFIAASGEMSGAEKLCLIKKVPEDRDSPGLTARLLDEARVAVRLNHTNLVQVFDAGRVEDELYIAMELIEGRDLRAVWNRTAERRSRIPLDVALYVVREMARGLDYAHNYGGLNLVHRDIAPPNVLLSFHGEVKVTDFGLARSILKNEKTAPGIVYGRVAYLAPEQARGEQADPRTDIYATGVILWELLTGRPLHDASEDAVKNLERARHPRVEPPSHITRGLPPTIDQVALKALASKREERYRTAEEFRKAVADELARVAPGTDGSRVSTFLRDLFGDEIKSEQDERERLLREELPKLRARTNSKDTPPDGTPLDEDPPTREMRHPPKPSDFPVGRPAPQPAGLRVSMPPPLPPKSPAIPRAANLQVDRGDPPTNVARRPSAVPPPRNAAPPPLASQLAATLDSQFDDSELDNERTTTVPPRGRLTGGATRRGPAVRPAAAVEQHVDPDSDEELANLVGQVVDARYRVERLLGTGGMGAVYEAEHIEIGKKVALKVLHPQFSRQADLVARFRREARAASKVGHPNIVDVTDSGTTENGDVYFVMERLDGLDLGEVLRHERRIAPDRTVHIGTQICRALSAAHAAGIIHRDLKPENIFLVSRDGNADFVKVLDFGIAKQDMGNQNHPRRLTTPGIAMGTPEYMAPEQAAGKAIDGRVDIYSVGAILYEMLTGEPPHAGPNVMDILTKKATQPPTPLRQINADISEPLEHVVLACLEREPDDRPQTMGALEYELNKSMKGRGSAVAAVLGLKPPPSDENGWLDNPQTNGGRARPASSPGFIPPPVTKQTGLPTGMTGALPLAADDGGVRVQKKHTREAIAPTVPLDEKSSPEFKKARGASKSSAGWVLLAGLLILGGGGYAAYKFLGNKPTPTPPKPAPVVEAPAPDTTAAKPPEPGPAVAAKTAKPGKKSSIDDDKMSPAEIDRMLEWARRTADGGRIIAPPGDNLKELLDRIEKADPGNAGAEALKSRTVAILQRKGTLALKKGRVDEAVTDLEALAALKPDDEQTHKSLARALRLRAEAFLGKKKLQAALTDVNAALELEPDDTQARITLADVLLAQGKPNEAADEYQRILDGKPADKRAKRGLLQATAAKAKPVPKKKKGVR
jgi:serine/threonine protein kinase